MINQRYTRTSVQEYRNKKKTKKVFIRENKRSYKRERN